MSQRCRWEYFQAIYRRYRPADRRLKQVILNEFCLNRGYHRKYAIRRRKFRREFWWIWEADHETQVRRYLGRFPGCVDPAHSEHILVCFILACEQAHA